MNLILLEPQELPDAGLKQFEIILTGRRHQHIRQIHAAQVGDTLRIGALNGLMGTAQVGRIDDHQVLLQVELFQTSPPMLPVTVLLALPRPKMLRRILQTAATLGVEQLYLINTWRVEKSYWQSPFLDANAIREQLVLGLEQAGATQLPEVHLRQRFKPFIEDEVPELAKDAYGLIAHPDALSSSPDLTGSRILLAIGPEGGFIPYEVGQLELAGFQRFSLGPRILRVETALPVLLARLFY
jgi:RsmE family RNA methyltransferase